MEGGGGGTMLMSTGMRLRPFSRMRTTVHSKP